MLNHIAGYTPNACTFDILSVDPDSFSNGTNVPNLNGSSQHLFVMQEAATCHAPSEL